MGKQARRLALVACALVAALVASAWIATPWYVSRRVLPGLWARYGLTMTVERQELAISTGNVDLYGVRILDGDEVILTAQRVQTRVSLRGLYTGSTVVERMVFDAPVLHARLDGEGRTNVGRILERRRADPKAVLHPATQWRDVRVHGGTLEFADRARGGTLRIRDIEASVVDVQTGSGAEQGRFAEITIDAKLEQSGGAPAPLTIVQWTTTSDSTEPTFVAHLALTGIDLDAFPAYVDSSQRTSLGVDDLDLIVSMDVRDGIIRRGAAIAMSSARTRPLTLLFGGPFAAPVVDGSSKLLALWELPFARLGRVGDVAWETGSAVGGGAIGVIEEIGRGDLIGAAGSAAEGVGGGVRALASSALDGIEDLARALGLGAAEETRDARAIHAHQRALFLAARREAAQEWSARAGAAED
jgi:hypothetical protein